MTDRLQALCWTHGESRAVVALQYSSYCCWVKHHQEMGNATAEVEGGLQQQQDSPLPALLQLSEVEAAPR